MPRPHRAALALTCLALACGPRSARDDGLAPSSLVTGTQKITIEPAPAELRGRVALLADARLYSRPSYASPSWVLRLPDPPLSTASSDGPARARAFRVIGVVRGSDPALGGSLAAPTQFVAVTTDLDGEDEDPPAGCGPRFDDLDHLRVLLYVPLVHLAEVTTRPLSLEPFASEPQRLEIGAGARVGPPTPTRGLPAPPAGTTWRSLDADGLRALAPIPDDAVGRAWDPGLGPSLADAGEPLLRDAEGSMMWLRDEGGASVELTLRNDCGELRRTVTGRAEVEGLRALALDVFYDQSPPPEPAPPVMDNADFLVVANTRLSWTDGELAGEILEDWAINVGVGQSWGNQRCFPLLLGGELVPLDEPAMACVEPSALEPLAVGPSFTLSDVYERGGSIELGPPELIVGGWDVELLRTVLNVHHDSVAECLRPLLSASEELYAARWVIALLADEAGRVGEVDVTALGATHPAVEDCLKAEAFTWLLPEGGGQVLIPVTLGDWAGERAGEEDPPSLGPPEAAPRKPKAPARDEDRGKVIIIRDDEPDRPTD